MPHVKHPKELTQDVKNRVCAATVTGPVPQRRRDRRWPALIVAVPRGTIGFPYMDISEQRFGVSKGSAKVAAPALIPRSLHPGEELVPG